MTSPRGRGARTALIVVLVSAIVMGSVGPHLATRARLTQARSEACDFAVGIVSGLVAQPGEGYRQPRGLLEPSLFATTWNLQTMRETTSFALAPELESFARGVVKATEGDYDVGSRLEAIDSAVSILGSSLIDSDIQAVVREIERLRFGDSYRVSIDSETSAYATLLAARVLTRVHQPLPVGVSERLVSGLSDMRPDFSLAEIDTSGIPTVLPLTMGEARHLSPSTRAVMRALVTAWDETVSNALVNGLTVAMRVWLREAHVELEQAPAPVGLGALKALDGGFALSPGGAFDPKATFLAVKMGARLDERDIARVRTGMATSGWLHVGEAELHSTYLATEIGARCGREPADSTALIEAVVAKGLDDVTIQEVFELCSLTQGNSAARASLTPTIDALRSLKPSNLREWSQLAVTARECDVEVPGTFDFERPGESNSLHALQEAALGVAADQRSLIASSRKTLATLQTKSGWSFRPGEEADTLSTFIGTAMDPRRAPRDHVAQGRPGHAPDLVLLLASFSTPTDLGALYPLIFFG